MQLESNRNSTSSMSRFIFDSHKRRKSTIQVVNDPSPSGSTICICSFPWRTDGVGGEGRGAAGNALTGSVLRTESLTHSPFLGTMEARASQPANTVSPPNMAGCLAGERWALAPVHIAAPLRSQDVTLVAWTQPWGEYSHQGNWRPLQISISPPSQRCSPSGHWFSDVLALLGKDEIFGHSSSFSK